MIAVCKKLRKSGKLGRVPLDKIVKRYYKSLANIKQLIGLCDILHVYDNTKEPSRIIRKHKQELTIFPNDFWDKKAILDLIAGNVQDNSVSSMDCF